MAACAHCGSDRIASLTKYVASCVGTVDANGAFVPGDYRDVQWDAFERVGFQCRSCFATELAKSDADEPGVTDHMAAALDRLLAP